MRLISMICGRHICIVTFLLLGVVISAQAANMIDVTRLQQANTLVALEQYAEAIPCWTALLRASPDSPQSAGWRYNLGVCYARTGQAEEAITQLETIRAMEPRSTYYGDALVQLFILFLNEKDEEKAAAARVECLAEWPQSEYVQRMLEAEFTLRPPEDRLKACRSFDEAQARNALPEEGYQTLLGLYYTVKTAEFKVMPPQQQPAAALQCLESIEASQRMILAHLEQRTRAARYCGYLVDMNLAQMLEYVRPLSNDDPATQPVIQKTREIYDITSRCENLPYISSILIPFQVCLEKDTQPIAWIPIYARLVQTIPAEEPKGAGQLLGYSQWVYGLACRESLLERPSRQLFDEAEAGYRLLIDRYPEQPEIKFALSELYALYRQPGREQDLTNLLAVASKSKSLPAKEWLAEMSYALATQEGYERAIAVLTDISKQNLRHPMRPVWLYRVGRCHQYLGKPKEAQIAFEQIIAGYPQTSCAVAAQWMLDELKGAER